jgi:hypothetical protein
MAARVAAEARFLPGCTVVSGRPTEVMINNFAHSILTVNAASVEVESNSVDRPNQKPT